MKVYGAITLYQMVRNCRLFHVFKGFSCKVGNHHAFSSSGIKMAEGFPIISNVAVTKHVTINYSRAGFIPEQSGSLNRNSVSSLHLDLKTNFSFQYGKSLSIVRLSLVLKSNESLPKYGKPKINSLLGTMKLRSFLINNLLK